MRKQKITFELTACLSPILAKTLMTRYLNNADLSILSSLSKIKELNIGYCNITKIPSVIFDFKNLTKLNLYANNLKELPPELFKMNTLKELIVSGNELKKLPDEIGDLKNLESLNIRGNPIKKLPESILKLKKLKRLQPPNRRYKMDYFPPELIKCLNRIDHSRLKYQKLISE